MAHPSEGLKKIISTEMSKSPRLEGVRKALEGYSNVSSKTRTTAGDNSNVNPMNGPIAGTHRRYGK
jgi:hypothetical protein